MNQPVAMIAPEVHPVPPRHGAAVEWWIYQVSRRLVHEWRPHVICIASHGYREEEVEDGVTFHRIRIGRLYKKLFQKLTRADPWGYAARAQWRMKRTGARIVHIHNDPELYRRLVSRERVPGRRYLLHLHNEREDLAGLEKAHLVAVSQYLGDWYGERLPAAKIEIVTNGVDTGQYLGARASTEERRQTLGIELPPETRVVLYAGRISPEKGLWQLVAAFRTLALQRTDAVLAIAGELSTGGPENRRAEYGRRVMQDLAALPAGRSVYLGSVRPERMHGIFACADLVVMPSEFEEPLGMVALEAMAAGVPLLAARKGGLKEIVREGETGFFIPGGGAEALAQRIDSLLSAGSLLSEVAHRARAYVATHHDWSRVAAQVSALYRGLQS